MFFVQWGTEEKNRKYVIRREEEISNAVSIMIMCKYTWYIIHWVQCFVLFIFQKAILSTIMCMFLYLHLAVIFLKSVLFIVKHYWKSDHMADVFSCVILGVLFLTRLHFVDRVPVWGSVRRWAAVEDSWFESTESKGSPDWFMKSRVASFCQQTARPVWLFLQSLIKPFRLIWAYMFITAVLILFGWFFVLFYSL